MAFTYPTVTVGVTAHSAFVTLAAAEIYLGAALHATGWAGATSAQKAQALVTATRMIDRQGWDGEKTDAANELSWPRSGLLDAEGEDVDSATLPAALVDATCELANALLEDASSQAAASAGSNVKRAVAGSVSVEFFGPKTAGRFPQAVQELIGRWLASSAGIAAMAPRTSGTDAESAFDPCDASDGFDLSY